MNPAGKLIVNLLFLTAALFAGNPVTSLAIIGLLMVYGIPSGGFRKRSALALLPFTLFAFSLIWMNGLWGVRQEADVLVTLMGAYFSVPGLEIGIILALRVMIIVISGLLLTMSSPPEDLVLSLMQQLFLPPGFAYSVLAALNLKDEIGRDKRYLGTSWNMRKQEGSKMKKIAFHRLLIPLLAINIRRCENISLAMEARGFGIRAKRTYYRRIPWRPRDTAFLISSAVLLLLIFAISLHLGLPIGYTGWKGYS